MSLLLLDPLVVTIYAAVAIYGWVVWSGRFRSWFAPDRLWLAAWPFPVVAAIVPLLVGPLLRAASVLGPDDDGGLVGVTVFLIANAVPIVLLSLAPPAVLLPPWARARLTPLPEHGEEGGREDVSPDSAVPAVHAPRAEGHVGWPRWRWRIDAVPGHAWVVDGRLHFVASVDDDPSGDLRDLEQEEIDQLDLQLGGDARLRPPRGGWWTRRRLDVELAELDAWRLVARRPRGRAGLLVLEVEGRRPVRLFATRADVLGDAITASRAHATE